jgi:hypothetical protein
VEVRQRLTRCGEEETHGYSERQRENARGRSDGAKHRRLHGRELKRPDRSHRRASGCSPVGDGACEDRTRDLSVANRMLSQLS